MGSPISPILATIILDHLIDIGISKLPFSLPFIYKFVDDIICSVPFNHIQTVQAIFNSLNQNIQFTVENENENSIPFLDTKVIRTNDNKIILDWYQKDTASGRFINYYSNHPRNQKFNTIISMKNRVTTICDRRFLDVNLNKLFEMFLNNGYPKHILKKLIYNTNSCDRALINNPQPVIYKKIPYVKNLTDQIVPLFKPFPNIKLVKYNPLLNSKLFSKTKANTPKGLMSNIIYKKQDTSPRNEVFTKS
ncbi:uncharacterized protein LOC126884400 [Diabrotica virgifera virgifera]|uniref:Helix-turn-helix domain-containing protein n=1 Tax=Diabrotica virgifera virgifera TaxID=50390 RepID=A0ABM5K7X2_DIAVI|nr:uncharacterized protein LOC126884400 [Diabrotica virgifera virgifera]